MVGFIIKIVSLFRGIFSLMGVDHQQLASILRVKLTMDNRRGFSTSRKKKDSNNQLLLQTFVYVVIGLFMGSFVNSVDHTLTAYLIVFSMIMVMIAMMMISEFSVVLIDTRDNAILMPRPVSSKTLALAKILHIAIYLLHMSLSLSSSALVFTIINYGFLAGLLFIFMVFLSTLFTLFLTNLFYLGLMRVVSGEKLKDILVYFQIGMAIVFMGAYQLLPRIIEMNDLYNAQLLVEWWTFFIPSAWFAGVMATFTTSVFSANNILFIVIALFLPIFSLWIIIRYLSPKFTQRLSQMEGSGTKPEKRTYQKSKRFNFSGKLGQVLTRNPVERTAFKMIWLMSGRERKFKQTAFPAFGYVFVMIAAMAFSTFGDENTDKLESLLASKRYLLFLYFNIFAAFAVSMNMIFSDESKSSWFFNSLPVSRPGDIISGSIKAVLTKYFLPLYLIVGGIIIYFWSYSVIPDILYALVSIAVITVFVTATINKALPFSKERQSQDSGSNFVKGILIMISAGLLGLMHWGLTHFEYGVLIALPVMLGLQYLSFRYVKKIKWNKIEH